MSTPVHLHGRLAAEPELRFTATGDAVCSLALYTSRRRKDDASGQWHDVGTTKWRVSAWAQLGEHIAESGLHPGDLVLVAGDLEDRSWTSKDGTERTEKEVRAKSVAVCLDRASVQVQRTERTTTSTAGDDPWATAPTGATNDDPPF